MPLYFLHDLNNNLKKKNNKGKIFLKLILISLLYITSKFYKLKKLKFHLKQNAIKQTTT